MPIQINEMSIPLLKSFSCRNQWEFSIDYGGFRISPLCRKTVQPGVCKQTQKLCLENMQHDYEETFPSSEPIPLQPVGMIQSNRAISRQESPCLGDVKLIWPRHSKQQSPQEGWRAIWGGPSPLTLATKLHGAEMAQIIS